jgi:hypothetical protein
MGASGNISFVGFCGFAGSGGADVPLMSADLNISFGDFSLRDERPRINGP